MACSKSQRDLTFLQILEDNYLECPMCQDTYKLPKSLTCLHTFCQACLEQYMKYNEGKLTCPTCRKETVVPEGGVTNLQSNFLVKSLTDDAAIYKKQKLKCDNCSDDKIATMVCADCASYLCPDCYKVHQSLKITRDTHNTFDVANFSKIANLREFQKNRFDVCQIHKEPMKLFCKTDQVQICHTCSFTSSHQSHQVSSLQEEVDDVISKVQQSSMKLYDVKQEFLNRNETLKKLLEKIRTARQKSLDDIATEKGRLLKDIEERYSQIQTEVMKSSDEVERLYQEEMNKNKEIQNTIDEKCKAQDALNVIPIMACNDIAKTMLDEFEEICNINHTVERDYTYMKVYKAKDNVEICSLPYGCIENEILEENLDHRKKLPLSKLVLNVGDIVVRGPDWCYEYQDGIPPGKGTVVKKYKSGEYSIRVKWDSGGSNTYRLGYEDCYDLKLA